MKVRIKNMPKLKTSKGVDPLSKVVPFPNLLSSTPFGLIESNTTGTADETITSHMKTVKPEDSNLEAEVGEVIVRPDLSGVYKIGGKKHSKGGTPLYAEGGSFIYSDSKDLAITKDEYDLFKLKAMTSKKVKNNTPAKVLQREVDTKEYNRLMSIIADPKQDKIAKTSAAIMLDKYQKKMGQIAYLQESKKEFPDGLPDFAMDTAPMSPPEQEEQEKMAESFAYGGLTPGFMDGIAGMPPDKTGKWAGDRKKTKNPKTGIVNNTWNAMTGFASPEDYARHVGFDGNPKDIKAMQKFVLEKYPEVVKYYHDPKTGYGTPKGGVIDGKLGVRWQAIAGNIFPPNEKIDMPINPRPDIPKFNRPEQPVNLPKGDMGPAPINPTIPWEGIQVPMNGMEKATIAAPALEALTAKSYYDMLSQIHLPTERLDRVSNAQELQDIREQASVGTRAAYANGPAGVANSIVANIRANTIKNIAGSNARTANQNTQIANAESQVNYGSAVDEMKYNTGQIHQTFNNNQLTEQRAGEFRRAGINASLNNATAIQTNLDNIGQAATASALPYLSNARDTDGNEILVDGEDGRKYTVQGAPFGINRNRMPTFNPMFGSLDSIGVSQQAAGMGSTAGTSDMFSKLVEASKTGNIEAVNAYSRAIAALNKSGSKGSSTPFENFTQALSRIGR